MNHDERIEKEIARQSALLYLPLSIGAAVLFLIATYFHGGDYTTVVRIGGAIWVALLSLIVSMPLVTSWVKKQK